MILNEIISKENFGKDSKYRKEVLGKFDASEYLKGSYRDVRNLMKSLSPDGKFHKQIVFDYNDESIDDDNVISRGDRRIMAFLSDKMGYEVTRESYQLGIAYKNGKTVTIKEIIKNIEGRYSNMQKNIVDRIDAHDTGSIKLDPAVYESLKKQQELLQYYSINVRGDIKYALNQSDSNELSIVISADPRAIASQSTCVPWQSCQTLLTGVYRQYVPKGITAGVLVAYLVRKADVETLDRPLSRVLIKPMVNSKNNSVLWYVDIQYGLGNKLRNKVKAILEKHNANLEYGNYSLKKGLYADSLKKVKVDAVFKNAMLFNSLADAVANEDVEGVRKLADKINDIEGNVKLPDNHAISFAIESITDDEILKEIAKIKSIKFKAPITKILFSNFDKKSIKTSTVLEILKRPGTKIFPGAFAENMAATGDITLIKYAFDNIKKLNDGKLDNLDLQYKKAEFLQALFISMPPGEVSDFALNLIGNYKDYFNANALLAKAVRNRIDVFKKVYNIYYHKFNFSANDSLLNIVLSDGTDPKVAKFLIDKIGVNNVSAYTSEKIISYYNFSDKSRNKVRVFAYKYLLNNGYDFNLTLDDITKTIRYNATNNPIVRDLLKRGGISSEIVFNIVKTINRLHEFNNIVNLKSIREVVIPFLSENSRECSLFLSDIDIEEISDAEKFLSYDFANKHYENNKFNVGVLVIMILSGARHGGMIEKYKMSLLKLIKSKYGIDKKYISNNLIEIMKESDNLTGYGSLSHIEAFARFGIDPFKFFANKDVRQFYIDSDLYKAQKNVKNILAAEQQNES